MSTALDTAIECLTERGACPECSHPVHSSSGGGRGWVHTATGGYRCPPGSGGTWAGPAVTGDMLDTAYDRGHADGCAHQEDIDNETMFTEDELAEKIEEVTAPIRAALDQIHTALDTIEDVTRGR